jgi:hypothetical protein
LPWTFDDGSTSCRANESYEHVISTREPPRSHMMRAFGNLLLDRHSLNHHSDLDNTLPQTTLMEAVGQHTPNETIPAASIAFPPGHNEEPGDVIGLADAIHNAGTT